MTWRCSGSSGTSSRPRRAIEFAVAGMSASAHHGGQGRTIEQEDAPLNLSNQVALVTGAGQGIGRATALALAAAGAHVVTVDINGQSAKEAAEAVAAAGPRGLPIQADMGSLADIDRMVAETVASFGKIDI